MMKKKTKRKVVQHEGGEDEFLNEGNSTFHDILERMKTDSDMEEDHETAENSHLSSLKREVNTSLELSQHQKKKRKKMENPELYKPPTVKEMNELRETENLFHSNLFRLQIEEMLKEVEVKQKHKILFQHWFDKLKSHLDSVSDSGEHDLNSLKWLKKLGVKMPLRRKKSLILKGNFKFIKPSSVTIIGSYALNSCLGPNFQVDINVEMPRECFIRSDHMNHRYHAKKALYLSFIAWILQREDMTSKLEFTYVEGDPLRPVLEATPSKNLGKHAKVIFHLSPQDETFKFTRFTPEKNNVRPCWFFGDADVIEDYLPPTPHHNNGILCDMIMGVNNNYLGETLKDHQSLLDGIRLLRVWLKQRKLDTGLGSFNGFILSMLVAYLVRCRRISTLGSSYQVVRCTWTYLAQCNWLEKGLSFLDEASETVPLSEFHQHFEVVFVDVTGYCNLCANMKKETFLKVKHEADAAVKSLDNPNVSSFDVLFMTPVSCFQQYDHIIRLTDVTLDSSREEQLDYCDFMFPLSLSKILEILGRGLGNRVFSLDIIPSETVRWPISETPPKLCEPITLGLLLNPVFAFSIIDKGPSANTEEAVEFRKFWGEKSELRRFQDGSICEAVIWPADTMSDKRLICQQITKYLLSTKLNISPGSIVYVADQLECLIKQNKVELPSFKYGTGEEAALAVLRAFDELSKQLRQLKDLPLDISVVQGISPVFRYCDTFPHIPSSVPIFSKGIKQGTSSMLIDEVKVKVSSIIPRWKPVAEAIIQLGLSKKWPDDLDAVQRVKSAFYIEIGNGMKKQFGLTCQPGPKYLEVLMSGYVFRIHLAHQGEVGLLKRQVTSSGVTEYKDTDDSLSLEKLISHLPALTGSLHGLHQQHPSYGPAVCLSKRWFSAQLLDSFHFPEVCVELLVAWLYLYPDPFPTPGQPQAAFLRLLYKLSTTDWSLEPVIVNFNDEMTREEILEIQTTFQNSRATFPPLFIATPQQRSGCIWTRPAPTLQILLRVAQLASESLQILESDFLFKCLDPRVVFRPPLDAYDVIIHLKHSSIPRRHEAVDCDLSEKIRLQNYAHHPGERIPVASFNPVEYYVQELRDTFSDVALFFYDVYGGDIITVLWIPEAKEERDFKVSRVNCRKLTKDGGKLKLNVDAILEDFLVIGRGLVESVIPRI